MFNFLFSAAVRGRDGGVKKHPLATKQSLGSGELGSSAFTLPHCLVFYMELTYSVTAQQPNTCMPQCKMVTDEVSFKNVFVLDFFFNFHIRNNTFYL